MSSPSTPRPSPDPPLPSRDEFESFGAWLLAVNLRALAREPTRVHVREARTATGIELTVECHPDDEEPLVGQQRRVAATLKTLLRELGRREHVDYTLTQPRTDQVLCLDPRGRVRGFSVRHED